MGFFFFFFFYLLFTGIRHLVHVLIVPPTKACLFCATPAGMNLYIQVHNRRHLPSAVPWISEDRLLLLLLLFFFFFFLFFFFFFFWLGGGGKGVIVFENSTISQWHLDSPRATLRAPLSGTFLQTLPDLVAPLKGHSLSPRSCPATRSAPSERFGY